VTLKNGVMADKKIRVAITGTNKLHFIIYQNIFTLLMFLLYE